MKAVSFSAVAPMTTRGRVRRLPIRTPPLPGESYASYVDRLAENVHARTSSVLYALGIIAEESDRAIGSGYGMFLDSQRVGNMAFALDLPESRIQEMLISHYDGRVIDLSGLDPTVLSSSRKIALREWAYFSGTHACPDCIRETGGVFQLRWKLPWSFACVRHERLLADHCPDCERRIGVARQDGSSRPRFISRIPHPGLCSNAQKPGIAATGRAAEPCGYPLESITTDLLSDDRRLLEAQKHLDGAIDSDTVFSLGEEIPTLQYFRELRSTVAFLLSVVEVQDVAFIRSESVQGAIDEHVAERSSIRSMRAGTKNWRNSARQRHFVGVSQSAALMAGVLPLAVGLLESSSTSALSASLGEYLERFRGLRSGSREHLNNFRFSDRLNEAADNYLSRYFKTTTNLGMRRLKSGRGSSSSSLEAGASTGKDAFGGLLVDEIPQLFWREDYERDLKPLLIASNHRYARRICSMWAAKALTRCSWDEAAIALELPVKASVGLKTRLLHSLNRDGNTEAFDERVRAVLRRVGADPERVDYRKRREAFEGFVDIPEEDWQEMCQKAGVPPGRKGGKSRQAAAWLWSEMVSSDHLLSPTFQQRDTENEREYFRRFMKRDMETLRTLVVEYGGCFLKRRKHPV